MRTSFLHLPDVHLGHRDPDDPDSFELIANHLRFAVDYAIEQRASFIVFSGNLFDSSAVDAATLQVALRGLARLRDKGIAAITIPGHPKPTQVNKEMSWQDLLCQDGLLAVLDVSMGQGRLQLLPWDRRLGRGSYLDLGRCRLFGLRYCGAMTGQLIGELADAIGKLDNRETDFRIVLLRACLEHFTESAGPKLSYTDLLGLERRASYVALGGNVKSYEAEGWAYDPGWSGLYHIAVDTAVKPGHHVRYVPFPGEAQHLLPLPPPEPVQREAIEESIFDSLVDETSPPKSRARLRDLMRMTTQLLSVEADPTLLVERFIEAADGILADDAL